MLASPAARAVLIVERGAREPPLPENDQHDAKHHVHVQRRHDTHVEPNAIHVGHWARQRSFDE